MNGIINIYKEQGFTSFDVVAKLRGICHQKKIGHTGTLDPDATGVLPVCLGNATKLCDLLMDKDKEYEAVLLLGVTTDTQDTSGTVIKEREVNVSEADVISCIQKYIGEIEQIPPMYSALKVNGKKLYELARAAVEVERKPRKITIMNIEVVNIELPRVTMKVTCSKGTYIRTLCNDIGESLGCGGTMEKLTRTRVGIFTLQNACKLSELQMLADEEKVESRLISVDALFMMDDKLRVKPESDKYLYNGNPFHKRDVDVIEQVMDACATECSTNVCVTSECMNEKNISLHNMGITYEDICSN